MGDIFDVLALKGTRRIVKLLSSKEEVKYSDIVEAVGFSTTTSRALKAMEKQGLVQKRALTEPYRPVAYRLTENGRKIGTIISEIESVR